MKAKIMMGFLLVVLGTAFGVAARSVDPFPGSGGDPTPICLPGKPCLSEK
jgi:hypothetical protein